MRVHWGWVLVGAVAGAVIWPKIGSKVTGAAKKAG
jgi:hypothetical protein